MAVNADASQYDSLDIAGSRDPVANAPEQRIPTTARCSGVWCTRTAHGLAAATSVLTLAGGLAPDAHADNRRLNDGVFADVYAIHDRAGCVDPVKVDPRLQLAAQWHAVDVMGNRNLDGALGSDGSSPQDRARNAGFHGTVTETVAINPALAISGIELLKQWYANPAYVAIMSDCASTRIGVWSENSLDRTVVVAVYGQPDGGAAGVASADRGGGISPSSVGR